MLTRSLDPEGASSNLARVILKDVGLTSHLLRVANSSLYNRSGKSIISIAHAITMLGWDTVRNLVGAMRFVEHYARTSPGLRELMMFSLLTATHGRQVASLAGYPRPEDAYVCGLFRNIGEIVLARYYGREYAELLQMIHDEKVGERAAFLRVFGFSLHELSQRLAAAWNLPPLVRLCLDDGLSATTTEEKCLASVTKYGHELTAALYRHGDSFDSVHLKSVIDSSGKRGVLSQVDLRRIVDCAVEDTGHTFGALQIPIGALLLEHQAQQARQILELTAPATPVSYHLEKLQAGIRAAFVAAESPAFDVSLLVQDVLDTLVENGGFERAIFALMSEDRMSVRGRLGSGCGDEQDLQKFRFSMLRSDPAIHAAVNRKTDLWVHRLTDPRYDSSRVVEKFSPSQFVLFPVIADGVVAGLLYLDRQTLQVPDEVRPGAERARDVLATAIARKRIAR